LDRKLRADSKTGVKVEKQAKTDQVMGPQTLKTNLANSSGPRYGKRYLKYDPKTPVHELQYIFYTFFP
jgi:hypothetical protein